MSLRSSGLLVKQRHVGFSPWSDTDVTSFRARPISSRSRSRTGARKLSWTISARYVVRSAWLDRNGPFAIDAIVVLPDHLHAIFTLPSNDADFPGRWRRIKGHFSTAWIDAGIALYRRPNGELALCKGDFGSTPFATNWISSGTSTTSISIRSSMALYRGLAIGHTHRFIATCGKATCRATGLVMSVKAEVTLESDLVP